MLTHNQVQAVLALRNDIRNAHSHYQQLWQIARVWSPTLDMKEDVQRVGRDLEKLEADISILVRDMATDNVNV
ncbi:hypothetical protein HS125_16750 [bacterium]|nr:hypothetical protein [bacterium]